MPSATRFGLVEIIELSSLSWKGPPPPPRCREGPLAGFRARAVGYVPACGWTFPPGLDTGGHGRGPCGVKITTPPEASATVAGDWALQWACAHALLIGPETTGLSLLGGCTVWECANAGAAVRARSATVAIQMPMRRRILPRCRDVALRVVLICSSCCVSSGRVSRPCGRRWLLDLPRTPLGKLLLGDGGETLEVSIHLLPTAS